MRFRLALFVTMGVCVAANDASAQTATQVVRFEVRAVNQIAVNGSPSAMVISAATAGSAPAPVTSGGASYAITTNESNQKITASIDQLLPSGITLEVSLAAPPGATSAGATPLSTAQSDVVTGISTTATAGLPITYRLSASAAAFVTAPESRTVTFTIVSGT